MINFDKEIQTQFDKVIKFSQESFYSHSLNTDNLFKQWAYNKEYIVDHFLHGQLIYEVGEIEKEVNDLSAQREKFDAFCEDVWSSNASYRKIDFDNFLVANKDGFYENKVIVPSTAPDGTEIPVGMKLVKAFKFFINNPFVLEAVQISASRLIQTSKLKGTLCFSVHPLDYLSVSENNYNWRSCHALNGEYRAGNLNYMADSSTVVCYVKGEEDTVLPRFPNSVHWNNKKWRVLIHFSEDLNSLFMGKQYPFTCQDMYSTISECLPKKGYDIWNHSYIKEGPMGEYLTSKYLCLRNKLIPVGDLIENNSNTYQFNDVISSHTYTEPYYKCNHTISKITVGKPVQCLHCNSGNICASDSMLCADCEIDFGTSETEDIVYCAKCGNRIWVDDANSDGWEWYCDNCWEEE